VALRPTPLSTLSTTLHKAHSRSYHPPHLHNTQATAFIETELIPSQAETASSRIEAPIPPLHQHPHQLLPLTWRLLGSRPASA